MLRFMWLIKIKSMQYRIQHESITLNEEKQIIREIKQLQGTRDKVIANAAMRAEVQKFVGEKDAIQDKVKSISVDLDEVRKDHQAIKAKFKTLETEKEAINNVIASLEEELCVVIEKKDKVYHKIRELRNKREEENTCFYQSRSLLNDARRLAASKDVNALIELSTSEVKMKVSRSLKLTRGASICTRKLARDMLVFWKRIDKEMAEIRKKE
ncbi:proton pump-interactor 1 isoform X3 [Helianthus annuus]|uniref:proton pump-interactor 1 isoform X3 n=1 Tax=Helianthus annuus TaxID=4232 RepID=UPI000B902D28|nr:proton pump-interactor 1 isoform X3 [Helianthus annuus]